MADIPDQGCIQKFCRGGGGGGGANFGGKDKKELGEGERKLMLGATPYTCQVGGLGRGKCPPPP